MKKGMKRFLCAALGLCILSTAAFCGCSDAKTGSGSGSTSPATADEISTEAPTDSPVAATGGKIHINDNTLGDIWITELEGVAPSALDPDGFTADDTFKYYSENGKPASLEGIDISSYSGDVDWKKVKNAGVDFVMVRVGGRGYGSSGDLYADERAVEYIKGAQAAGIKAGGYFFSQATTNAEAVEEADFAHEVLGGVKLDFPLAYDWEIIKDDDARTDSVTATQATECAVAFCERVKALGYQPMVYSAPREFYFKYDMTRLADYGIWLVEYANEPTFYYAFSMWQYSESGYVDGIDTAVDLNICFTSVAEYAG